MSDMLLEKYPFIRDSVKYMDFGAGHLISLVLEETPRVLARIIFLQSSLMKSGKSFPSWYTLDKYDRHWQNIFRDTGNYNKMRKEIRTIESNNGLVGFHENKIKYVVSTETFEINTLKLKRDPFRYVFGIGTLTKPNFMGYGFASILMKEFYRYCVNVLRISWLVHVSLPEAFDFWTKKQEFMPLKNMKLKMYMRRLRLGLKC